MKITEAQTYGIPSAIAKKALIKYCNSPETNDRCRHPFIRSEIANMRYGKAPSRTAVVMINRVYLARRIEYTYSVASGIRTKANIHAQLEKLIDQQNAILKSIQGKEDNSKLESSQVSGQTSQKTTTNKTPAQISQTNKNVDNEALSKIEKTQTSLQEILDKLEKDNKDHTSSSPLVTERFSIESITGNSVTLAQQFARPVVVGYRYVALATERSQHERRHPFVQTADHDFPFA